MCGDELLLDFRTNSFSTNIGSALRGSEKTRENDAYDAALDVYSGYAMLDVEVIKSLRTVGGARVEKTEQSIDSFDPFAIDEVPVSGNIDETDVLPALSLVYAATSKANARLAVTRTLSRPQLREWPRSSSTRTLVAFPPGATPIFRSPTSRTPTRLRVLPDVA